MSDQEQYFRGGQYVENQTTGYIWYLFEQDDIDTLNKGRENGKTNIDHKDCDSCKNDVATFFDGKKYYCDTCLEQITKHKKFYQ